MLIVAILELGLSTTRLGIFFCSNMPLQVPAGWLATTINDELCRD